MSLVCLQYGQCGNQVGSELFNTVSDDIGPGALSPSPYLVELTDKWFHDSCIGYRKARSILIDTEQKVVSNLKFSSKSCWSFDRKLVATSNIGGSGNNWALGYYSNGLEFVEKVLDLVSAAAEKSHDGVDGFVSILGLGGGTGSGLSCFIGQSIADHYPKTPKSSVAILPFSDGDVCTQSYNTILSLTKLYENQDAIFLFSNDYIYKLCSQVLKIKQVKLNDMNHIIAEQLACSLSVNKKSELIKIMTPHPLYRLISLRSSPHIPPSHTMFEPTQSWHSIVDQLKMSLVKSDLEYDFRPFSRSTTSSRQRSYNYYKCVANLLTCRGPDFAESEISTGPHPLNDVSIYPHWYPHKPQYLFRGNNKKFARRDRFATLITNCGFPFKLLEPINESGRELFSYGTYLHHYYKHGLDKEDFTSAFESLNLILNDYKSLI